MGCVARVTCRFDRKLSRRESQPPTCNGICVPAMSESCVACYDFLGLTPHHPGSFVLVIGIIVKTPLDTFE